MIELRDIRKYFPSNGIMALENAQLTLAPGEIHALLGENGSGKSTLMHILAGYFPPTSGSILLAGKERRFSSPAGALALGIGMLRQHPGFIRGFKVWENCILGCEKQGPNIFFNPNRLKKQVEEKASQWHFDLPFDKDAESLTVSQRQTASILSLLLRDTAWFIFDEPTAVLSPEETKILYGIICRLRSEGRGVILITHKLDEALAVSDRVTVIRQGITNAPVKTSELSIAELNSMIFAKPSGSNVSASEQYDENSHSIPQSPVLSSHSQIPVLQIKDLSLDPPGLPAIRNLNLNLMPGTLTGIAGDGGLETLELALTGFLNQAGNNPNGAIAIKGRNIAGKGIQAFRKAGGAYLGADRLANNLALKLPLSESLIIHACRRERRGIFLDMGRLNSWCGKIMESANIKRHTADKPSSFSGGMLQRILLAREFAENASLFILAEAGSGLDQSNRERLACELKALAGRGAAALLLSTDAEELSFFTSEIMLLRNGALTKWNNDENN